MNFLYKNIIYFLIIINFNNSAIIFAENHISIERRAAIDIGSGTSKLIVADVEVDTNKVIKIIYSDFLNIKFSDKLIENSQNIFDDDIYILAVNEFSNLLHQAKLKGAVRFSAIATEAFRKALNGTNFIARLSKEINIPIQIISQEDEAVLGYETAIQTTEYPTQNIVSWDSGSGSVQLTSMSDLKIINHLIPIGTTAVTQLLDNYLMSNNKRFYNELSQEELIFFTLILQKKLIEPNEVFKDKLLSLKTSFIGIGSKPSTMGVCSRACEKKCFSSEDLWSAILLFVNKEDVDLIDLYNDTTIKTVFPRLLLTYSIMSFLNINEIKWVETHGNCLGVFGMTKYWN